MNDKIIDRVTYSTLENSALIGKIKKLEQQLKEAESVIDMVEDNRKMPHQHKDYYKRLCCLSERAREYNEKYKTNE
jgi:hypothetical protein